MPSEQVIVLVLSALAVALAAVGLAVARGRELRHVRAAAGAPRDGEETTVTFTAGDVSAMADWLGAGLLLAGRSGRIELANEAAHGLLGRPPGTLIGMTLMEAFVDHRAEEVVREAASRGAARRELLLGGEPQRTLLLRAKPAGARRGLWLIVEDVSELRRLQRIRTEFIGNLSHELRTPLTTVRLLVDGLTLALERTDVPPRVRDSVGRIDVETGHLVQMVNELLDLARIEQGEAPLRLEILDLGAVVETMLDRLRLYAERHDVRLRGEMPATAAERTVRGDGERLGQLLVNLLHNAIKFSPPSEEVVARLRTEGDELLLEVVDRGPGIPRAELDRIFERFYKVDRARGRTDRQSAPATAGGRGPGGTGLGLAIARHIAERHGGRIWAESVEGRGSRFVLALPRAVEADASLQPE